MYNCPPDYVFELQFLSRKTLTFSISHSLLHYQLHHLDELFLLCESLK